MSCPGIALWTPGLRPGASCPKNGTDLGFYTGDIWSRTTAFGDRLGRQNLYEMGITLDFELTHVVQGLASGGPNNGPGTRSSDLLDYGMTFETGKRGLWSGGLFVATAQTSFGKSILGKSGNISPPKFLGIYPTGADNNTVLMEYYWMQALPADIVVIIGRLNAGNFLDKNWFANDPRSQFLNLWGLTEYSHHGPYHLRTGRVRFGCPTG